jgi:hypothetical protein
VSAWVNGFIGLFVSLGLGTQILGFSVGDCLRLIVGSNFAGFTALLLILIGEGFPGIKRTLLRHGGWTWFFFASLYLGLLLGPAPELRSWRPFWILIVPLILSTGFIILLFGPIQDWRVRRIQRRQLRRTAVN